MKYLITVDFEDFSLDFCRSIGVPDKPKSRAHALKEAYKNFSYFMKSNFNETRATFFCTGIIAETYPEIIKEIHSDGNEIACHNYFHDDISNVNLNLLEANLSKAKKILKDITGEEVLGFRAPRFSLDKEDKPRLEKLGELFLYDSSLNFSSKNEFLKWRNKYNQQITELPVGEQHNNLINRNIKLGGSYFKLLPFQIFLNALKKTSTDGLIPILYLHPYDLLPKSSFTVNLNELKGLKLTKKYFCYIRQLQWTYINNKQIHKRLTKIGSIGTHKGLMRDLVR